MRRFKSLSAERAFGNAYSKEILLFYLIPLMIGLSGIFFSRQFQTDWVRSLIVLVCVATAEFVIGNSLARLHSEKTKPIFFLLGAIILILGGGVAIWDLSIGYQEERLPDSWEWFYQRFFGLSKILGSLGLFVGLVVMFYMVLRREEEAERLARHFTALTDLMSEGFVLVAPDGTIARVNKNFYTITGLTPEDLQGESNDRCAEKLGLKTLVKDIKSRLEKGVVEYQLTWTNQGKERRILVAGTPVVDEQNNLVSLFAAFRDITEIYEMSAKLERYAFSLQQLVEDRTGKLRSSEERLRNLLIHMSEGFVTLNKSGEIVFVNTRFCEMLKLGRESLMGKPILNFLANGASTVIYRWLGEGGTSHHAPVREEWSLRCSDGGEVAVVAALAPITWDETSPSRYSVVITDISELKRMQTELERRAAELDSANKELRKFGEAKDAFLTAIGHELRTPLSTIMGYVEMFQSGSLGKLENVQERAIAVISRNAERLGSLVEEIIEFSRTQVLGIHLDLSLFQLEVALRECARSFEPQLAAKQMRLEFNFPNLETGVWADRKRLIQTIGVFISNAIKFSPKGTAITLSVDVRPPNGVAISVQDQGIGIDPVHHKRIFETFYQVDQSLSRRYEGAGIGLSVAKAIADAHESFIEVQSSLGKGSCFTWVLPRALFSAGNNFSEEKKLNGTESVLFLDNGLDNERLLWKSFERRGYTVIHAGSSAEALRLASERQPKLFVTHWRGQAGALNLFVERFLSLPNSPNMPVVVLCHKACDDAELSTFVKQSIIPIQVPETEEEIFRRLKEILENAGDLAVVLQEKVFDRQSKSVLVVDEDAAFRRWLEIGLRRKGIICRFLENGEPISKAVEKYAIGTLVIDWDSPRWLRNNGAELEQLLAITERNSAPSIVLMTVTQKTISSMAGTYHILFKPFQIDDLVHILEQQVPS